VVDQQDQRVVRGEGPIKLAGLGNSRAFPRSLSIWYAMSIVICIDNHNLEVFPVEATGVQRRPAPGKGRVPGGVRAVIADQRWHSSLGRVLEPAFGQVQSAVDQGVPVDTGVASTDADLAVVRPSQHARAVGPLELHYCCSPCDCGKLVFEYRPRSYQQSSLHSKGTVAAQARPGPSRRGQTERRGVDRHHHDRTAMPGAPASHARAGQALRTTPGRWRRAGLECNSPTTR